MQIHTATKVQKVQIGDVDLDRVFYRGQPVVTFAQIDRAHKRPDGTAKRNFDENRDRFVPEEDFVEIGRGEIRTDLMEGVFSKFAPKGILIPRRGYLKLCKSLTDDLAWSVFDDMIDRYFAAEEGPAIPNFSDPAAAARAWATEYEARQIAERTKAEIGSRREATAMNTASQAVRKANALKVALVETKLRLDEGAQFATVKRLEKHYGRKLPWRALKQKSIELGLPMPKIADANYEEVNAYHADVWQAVYGLSIPAVES